MLFLMLKIYSYIGFGFFLDVVEWMTDNVCFSTFAFTQVKRKKGGKQRQQRARDNNKKQVGRGKIGNTLYERAACLQKSPLCQKTEVFRSSPAGYTS